MKILITGGLGTIGRPLVRRLRSLGHQVWVVDLIHHHDSQCIRADVSSFWQMQQVFTRSKYDLVYHLAAEFGRWNGEDYFDTLWRTNMVGTKNVIRFQEQLGFRLVFASSSEVYGDFDGVMSETVMDTHEIRQLNDYAMTKWVGEQQILNSADAKGTETVRASH